MKHLVRFSLKGMIFIFVKQCLIHSRSKDGSLCVILCRENGKFEDRFRTSFVFFIELKRFLQNIYENRASKDLAAVRRIRNKIVYQFTINGQYPMKDIVWVCLFNSSEEVTSH